ncbi:MAG: hypothetical protein FJ356_04445 [Thaumarchaeota archaeon]|nr:hypothetical protein [Nitrososphaerota archaeon]
MDRTKEAYFSSLPPSEKIIWVLKQQEDYGGPQSAERLCTFLGMKRKNLDSLLSRLYKRGKIERVSMGVYRLPGDEREPKF